VAQIDSPSPAEQVPLEVWKIIVGQIKNEDMSPFFTKQLVSLRLVNKTLDMALSPRFYAEVRFLGFY